MALLGQSQAIGLKSKRQLLVQTEVSDPLVKMPSVEEMNKMFDDASSGGESPLPNIDVVASEEEEEASPVAVAEESSDSEEGVEDYAGVSSVKTIPVEEEEVSEVSVDDEEADAEEGEQVVISEEEAEECVEAEEAEESEDSEESYNFEDELN